MTSRSPNGKTAQTDVYWSQVQRQLHHCVHLNLFNIALSLGAMKGISQDCSSLHQYLQFTNSVHWILHHCVHLRLFSIALSSGAMGGSSKTVHHYISICDSPIVFTGFSSTVFTCTSLMNYISSSLHHSVHCILHHCVHLHLFGELHLFITTSQCSLRSPCHWVHHLFRELHQVITIWENLSVLDSFHCCGHLHLFTKLVSSSLHEGSLQQSSSSSLKCLLITPL